MALSRDLPAGQRQATPAPVCDLAAVGPSLRAAWEDLAERLGAGPTLRPWWFELLLRDGPVEGDLLALTVRRGGALTALLALVRRGAVLRSPTSWDTPAYGILAADEHSADTVARACIRLPSRRVDFSFLPEHDLDRLTAAAREQRRWVLWRPLEVAPYVDLSPGWEAVEQGLRRKFRQSTRRATRQMEAAGQVVVERVSNLDRLQPALDWAFRIEASGWKGAQRTASIYRPQHLRFYTAMAFAASKAGRLALDFLVFDGRPVAMCFGLEGGHTYHLMKTAYDDAYAQFSPGHVLMRTLVRSTAERGLRVFDFLGGDEDYKRRWTDLAETRSRFQAFAPTPSGWVDRAVFAYGRPVAKRVVGLVR